MMAALTETPRVTVQTHETALVAQLGWQPVKTLRMVGMRRSGNHAIANWLQRNASTGKALFLNNCRAGRDPFRHHNGLEVSGHRCSAPLEHAAEEAGPDAMLLLSYEDTTLGRAHADRDLSGPLSDQAFDHSVLVYRSFLNWSASLLAKLRRNPRYRSADRAAVMMRSIATYGDLLAEVVAAQDQAQARGSVAICYDHWVESDLYRAQRLQALGLEVRDNSLGMVQAYGGGSSFQPKATTATELDVMNRWRGMAKDPEYRAVLSLAALDDVFVSRLTSLFPDDATHLMTLIGANALVDAPTKVEGI
ncbi:hypothetical protein [Phaeobacter sp.]|uniref:hypothetical protein n=1 Tax=Phaeobacter sp. TaxID=1902409 RepID=UPI0025F9669D|nr:hypothetical protein [Phaeobacter sp.]